MESMNLNMIAILHSAEPSAQYRRKKDDRKGVIPTMWKATNITRIHKTDSRTNPANYIGPLASHLHL